MEKLMQVIFEKIDDDKYKLIHVKRVKSLAQVPSSYIRESKDYMHFDEKTQELHINSLRMNVTKVMVVGFAILDTTTKDLVLSVIRCAINEYEAKKNGIIASVYTNTDKTIITTH
jgi:hypothetical protein